MPQAVLLGVSGEIDQRSIGIRFFSFLVNTRIRIISVAIELIALCGLKKSQTIYGQSDNLILDRYESKATSVTLNY